MNWKLIGSELKFNWKLIESELKLNQELGISSLQVIDEHSNEMNSIAFAFETISMSWKFKRLDLINSTKPPSITILIIKLYMRFILFFN